MNININYFNAKIDKIFDDFTIIKVRLLEFRDFMISYKIPSADEVILQSKKTAILLLKDTAIFALTFLALLWAWKVTVVILPIIMVATTLFLGFWISLVLNIGFIVLGYPLVVWMYSNMKSILERKQQGHHVQYFIEQDEALSVLSNENVNDASSAIAHVEIEEDVLNAISSIEDLVKLTSGLSNRNIKKFLYDFDTNSLRAIASFINDHCEKQIILYDLLSSREYLISQLYSYLRQIKQKQQELFVAELEAYN